MVSGWEEVSEHLIENAPSDITISDLQLLLIYKSVSVTDTCVWFFKSNSKWSSLQKSICQQSCPSQRKSNLTRDSIKFAVSRETVDSQ